MEEIKTLIGKIKAHNSEFEKYYSQLIEYNSKVNLTAITERNEVFVKHFLDSILPIAEIKTGASVVDVGSGAGFPSLPIKIVRPDISLTMVDSLNKRVNFLNEVLADLGIKNAKAVHSRAEDFCVKTREKFDVAVARAVAKLNTLVEYLLPLVKVGGVVLAYKGSGYIDELNEAQKAIEILGGKVEKVLTYNLPVSLEKESQYNLSEKNSTKPKNGLENKSVTKSNNIENENLSNSKLSNLEYSTTTIQKSVENENSTAKQNETLGERNIIVIKKIKPTPKQYPRGQNKPKTQPIC